MEETLASTIYMKTLKTGFRSDRLGPKDMAVGMAETGRFELGSHHLLAKKGKASFQSYFIFQLSTLGGLSRTSETRLKLRAFLWAKRQMPESLK